MLESHVGEGLFTIEFEDLLWQKGGGIEGFNLDLKDGANGLRFYQCKFPIIRNMAILGNATSHIGILMDGGLGEGSDGQADATVMGGTTFHDLNHIFMDRFLDCAIRLDTSNFRFALCRKIGTGTTVAGSEVINFGYADSISFFSIGEYISSARTERITTVIGSYTVTITTTTDDIPIGANLICAAITYDATVVSKTATTLTLSRPAFKDGNYTATVNTDVIPEYTKVKTNSGGVLTMADKDMNLPVLATRSITGALLMERVGSAGLKGAWCNRGISHGVQIQGNLSTTPDMIGLDIAAGSTNELHMTTQACKIGTKISVYCNANEIHTIDESRALWSVLIDPTIQEPSYWHMKPEPDLVTRGALGNVIRGYVGIGYTSDGGVNTEWHTNEKVIFPKQSSIPSLTNVVFTTPTATIAPIRMPPGAPASVLCSGSLWHDATQLSWMTRTGNLTYRLNGTWYSATADRTLNNSLSDLTIVPTTGVGTRGLVANSWAIGRSMRFKLSGIWGTFSSQTGLKISLKLGTTVVAATAVLTLPVSIPNGAGWSLDATITIRSLTVSGPPLILGTCVGQGTFTYGNQVALLAASAAVSIDTAISLTPDVTAQWTFGTAANTITTTNCTFEMLS
jgi:hypothetical protein